MVIFISNILLFKKYKVSEQQSLSKESLNVGARQNYAYVQIALVFAK
jgi:hypothetical protein